MYGDGRGRPIREHARTVAVVGAGASGLLTARALLRAGHPSVVLIERDAAWGAGPAYSTTDPEHVLNVPAGRLSADGDDPTDFVEWVRSRGVGAGAASFLPRSTYGEYLQDSVSRVARRAPGRLTRVTGDVVSVAARTHARHRGRGVRVVLSGGPTIDAAHAVLALGNPPSRPLPGTAPTIIEDPWSAPSRGIESDDPVLLVGSGLTAVDVALSLAARGHRRPIQMVSRRALLPRAHVVGTCPSVAAFDPGGAPTAHAAVAALRMAIADAGGDWRAVFDAIRHDTNELWAGLAVPERARLLRHAARYWEVHRHRMAPEVAARIDELVASGRVELRPAAVTACEVSPDGTVRVTMRGAESVESTWSTTWVVNCTGPDFDLRRSGSPLIRDLFARGLARSGPVGLGLDVTIDGALVDRAGSASAVLSVVGPLRRGVEWETTAIPDIRRQADALAARIARDHAREARPAGSAVVSSM